MSIIRLVNDSLCVYLDLFDSILHGDTLDTVDDTCMHPLHYDATLTSKASMNCNLKGSLQCTLRLHDVGA